MAAYFFNIEANVDEVQNALKGTARSIATIQKMSLRTVASGAAKVINKKLKSVIHGDGKIKGIYPYKMSSAYRGKIKKGDPDEATIYPKGIPGGTLIIPVITTLNYGATINVSRRHKYMKFQNRQGEWKSCKSVRIPGRHFIESGEKYLESDAYMNDLSKLVDKELKKYWG